MYLILYICTGIYVLYVYIDMYVCIYTIYFILHTYIHTHTIICIHSVGSLSLGNLD